MEKKFGRGGFEKLFFSVMSFIHGLWWVINYFNWMPFNCLNLSLCKWFNNKFFSVLNPIELVYVLIFFIYLFNLPFFRLQKILNMIFPEILQCLTWWHWLMKLNLIITCSSFTIISAHNECWKSTEIKIVVVFNDCWDADKNIKVIKYSKAV